MDFKSVLAGGPHRGDEVAADWYPVVVGMYPVKFWWFQKNGYSPHIWQALFHGASDDGHITRFRHLVAGRRGGKTLSAAWEVLFYALHPSEFHRDVHGTDSTRPLWIWILAKDHPTGYPSLSTFLDVIRQSGLVKGKDYEYNKTERRMEFESGTVIQFKTAEDPESLRGAGLDILWIDEAAIIDSLDAWLVVRPALSDKLGRVITTTTPKGKNWFWEEFFSPAILDAANHFRVEYTSIDNPYFPREEWEEVRVKYHPVLFRQEYLASFDAFAGIALEGDWLKYWVHGKADPASNDVSISPYKSDDGRYNLTIYLGVDPAISLSDSADNFVIAAVGKTQDNSMVFLLDYFIGRLPFPDQVDKIREWQIKWRPQYIGIESNAYQKALYEMVNRLETLPTVIPVMSKGKKNDRIMAMSPLFKIGKVRINRLHSEFIEQWVNFDPEKKNQKDDLLDAVEIALGTAGVLLPLLPETQEIREPSPENIPEVVRAQFRALRERSGKYDPELGSEA